MTKQSDVLEGLGEPKKKYSAEDFLEKAKKLTPFEFINDINSSKNNLIVDDITEKQYNAFMINKGLSFDRETIILANEMNSRHHLDNALQNTFLINTIRAKKRYNKWVKAEENDELEMIKEYYGYSNEKARQALAILSQEQKQYIKEKLYKGGNK
jgi:hypothetical protein